MHRYLVLGLCSLLGALCAAGHGQSVVELRGDKCPLVDGRPFFAVGMYSVGAENLQMLAAAGFNLVHTYGWEGQAGNDWGKYWLDAAHQSGLKALVGLYRPHVKAMQFEGSAKRIEMYRDHPALLAWHTMDEPAWDKDTDMGKDYMPAAYQFVREHDPTHPVTAVTCHFADPARFENAVDIMQADYYPVPPIPADWYSGTGFRGIKMFVDNWRKACGGKKPFWFVCQAFDFSLMKEKSHQIAEEWKRFPTLDELRTMTYTAIASGARGVLYWSYSHVGDVREGGTTREEHWDRIATVVGELRALMPLLTADTPETIVQQDNVVAMAKSDGKDTYVIAANYERTPTQTVLTIPGIETATAQVVFGEGQAEITDGKLTVNLGAVESRVYRVAGAQQ